MSVRFIKKPNGRLQAVRRGSPPPAPDGYRTMKGDKFMFEPILSPCEFREERERKNTGCACKAGTLSIYCTRDSKWVIPVMCLKMCELGGAYESQ